MENKVEAIVFSDNSHEFAVFTTDKILSVQDLDGNVKKSFVIDNVEVDYETEGTMKGIRLDFHSPYICVSQRFGLNAAVVDTDSGKITKLSREDYCSEVSSFSIGFLDFQGKTLLLHQTQWNRLDITDLKAGELLTQREISKKYIGTKFDEKWNVDVPQFDEENYLDFFHSLIHISPDSSHFLSNGWLWHPVGQIFAFKTEEFFKKYELCNKSIRYWNVDHWDRPCAFIDSSRFVVATDNNRIWKETDIDKTYRQLWFFDAEDFDGEYIPPYKKVKCNIFKLNKEKEAAGELYFDKEINRLVAVSEAGAYTITLDGEITAKFPQIKLPERESFGFIPDHSDRWRYSTFSHVFYRYDGAKRIIEKISVE